MIANRVPDRKHLPSLGIAVMAKASAPGRTKTRLVPPLTSDEAAAFNTAFLKDVAANLLHAGSHGTVSGFMAYGPPGTDGFFRDLMPQGIGAFECWQPGFGACLRHAAETVLGLGFGAVGLLNADSPNLPTAFLIEAASVLSEPGDRAVLGPSSDGGYYLLGIKRLHARLFEDIAWSTEVVAEQTLERARQIELPVHLLPTWYDVDDAASLSRLVEELSAEPAAVGAARPSPAIHTRSLVARLMADSDLRLRLGEIGTIPVGSVSCRQALGGARP